MAYWAPPHSCEHIPDLSFDFSDYNGSYYRHDSKLLHLMAEREGLDEVPEINLESARNTKSTIIEWDLIDFQNKDSCSCLFYRIAKESHVDYGSVCVCRVILDGDEMDIVYPRFNVRKSSSELARPVLDIRSSTYFGGSLQIVPCSGDNNIPGFKLKAINLEPSSDSSLGLAENWMNQCTVARSDFGIVFTPTRLLEINNPSCCRIVEPVEGTAIDYAALSYSWGGPQDFALTNASYTSFLNGFPLSKLPSTLRDSIIVARKLGFQYIFIDALCIIQDKPDDVGKQIGLMPHLYSHAEITIIASRSMSVKEGFLHRRSVLGASSNVFKAILTLTKDAGFPIVLLSSQADMDDGSAEPLSHRAWAFQERLLSSRILDYGSRVTKWVCSHGHCRDMIDGWKLPAQTADHTGYVKVLVQTRLILESARREEGEWKCAATTEQIWKTWTGLINLYTGLDITKPTDRLPAISALASRFSSLLKSRYLGGLWESFLPWDLLWATQLARRRRTKDYQGPSWSWSAVQDAVSFISASISIPLDDKFQILSCETQPLYIEAAFGEVLSASLTLKGRTRAATWTRDPASLDANGTPTVTFQDSSEDDGIDIYHDTTAEEFESTHSLSSTAVLLVVVAVKIGRERKVKQILGLVLFRRRSGEYLRVARFHLSYGHGVDLQQWLNNAVVKEITIV